MNSNMLLYAPLLKQKRVHRQATHSSQLHMQWIMLRSPHIRAIVCQNQRVTQVVYLHSATLALGIAP